ncbi:MAG: pitrilysin family protein [Eubacteriales bacterium]|nr:pitrilysin family protein [Eubacteriales bacterium]
MTANIMTDYQDVPAEFHALFVVDPLTGKSLHTYHHTSGLTVKYLPRPGFSRSFAALTIPYGSIHTEFTVDGESRRVPAGTAHFLEHCVFSRDASGGLLGALSDFGASANAYTTHTHTLYYFSTVDHFGEALRLFFQTVLNPYLETDRIESERPVIQAELNQYMDDPDTRAYMKTVEALYEHHPVRADIGGTIESVATITDDHLKQVWRHFYQPAMLTLTIVGDLDERQMLEAVASLVASSVRPAESRPLPVFPEHESLAVNQRQTVRMDVAAPSFLLGIRDPQPMDQPIKGCDLVYRQRAARLALDCLLSPVSPLYENLYRQGLIHDSFDYHYSCEESFAFLICGGESPDPEKAALAVRDALIESVAQPLPADLFETQKRSAAGEFVSSLDSIEYSGIVQARCSLSQVDLFDYPRIYDKITSTGAADAIRFLADPGNYTITLLQPGRHEVDE